MFSKKTFKFIKQLMQVYRNITPDEIKRLILRPGKNNTEVEQIVQPILNAVKQEKDLAIHKYTHEHDGVLLNTLEVTPDEKLQCSQQLSDDLKSAIKQAKENIEKFHEAQRDPILEVETMPGVHCWRKSLPIQKVGLYVPGGTAPLFSTVLMLAVPAKVAGCSEIVICTPPQKDQTIHPAIIYAAELSGVHRIFKIGGAQAIAAMAYGTETVPQVFKIFGPGNQYVAVAKQLVNKDGVAIDLFAGPSEVLILADHTANPVYVASDLLAQAEHGKDSHCLLVTTSQDLLDNVQIHLKKQIETNSRFEILQASIKNFRLILVKDLNEGIAFSNLYAPEHLIIATQNAKDISQNIENAGSVFIGHHTPVSVGDYASGTNHTLPTNGSAIAYSGVSLDSFIKKVTFQELTIEGLKNIGPIVKEMAEAEKLPAHSNSISVRLNDNG
ncbi:histidinol dehydrogenase [Hydrotalea sp. AMD]|uniref:histidinol dehydrogenase n=1 Tax=Hydrotalea sp. AMD TaxID=2501297 RepID=UPI00257969EF|nr:histidinol dehydrogenase [Hydrotalea sp. AMD]